MIEKAYAKIHNCYESLISGFIDDGLTDMTGLVSEKIKLTTKKGKFPARGIGTKDEIWSMLKKYAKQNTMMGCSRSGGTEHEITIDDEPVGILSGHAYSIIDVIDLDDDQGNDEHKLLRIRNPWGNLLFILLILR